MTDRVRLEDHQFESGSELVEVTSDHRPDTTWCVVDAQGHEHRWHTAKGPVTDYTPQESYQVTTLIWVKDGEDGEGMPFGHYECRECGARIAPGYTADTYRQFIPCLRWYRIDGHSVSEKKFMHRLTRAHVAATGGLTDD